MIRMMTAYSVTGLLLLGAIPATAQDQHDPVIFHQLLIEEAEYRHSDDGDESFNWDADAWIGSDFNKLRLRSEGEFSLTDDEVEEAELQALYSRNIGDFFDAVAGVRHDFEPENEWFGVIGLTGTAPYRFEVDTALFIEDDADVTGRFEAEYEILITQKLVLQPALETNVNFGEFGGSGIGAAFDDVELGLRLRYETVREFAPYVGINWERALGDNADDLEDEGEDVDNFAGIAGIHFWF